MAAPHVIRFPIPVNSQEDDYPPLVDFFTFLNTNKIGEIGNPQLMADELKRLEHPFPLLGGEFWKHVCVSITNSMFAPLPVSDAFTSVDLHNPAAILNFFVFYLNPSTDQLFNTDMGDEVDPFKTYSTILYYLAALQLRPIFLTFPMMEQQCVINCCFFAAGRFEQQEDPDTIRYALEVVSRFPDLGLFKKLIDHSLTKLTWFPTYLRQFGTRHNLATVQAIVRDKIRLSTVKEKLNFDM